MDLFRIARQMSRRLCCTVLVITLFSFAGCAKKATSAGSAYRNSPEAGPAASPEPAFPANMETAILYYVNLHRRARGLKALRLNGAESSVAAQHSRDMASGRTPFGHKGLQTRYNMIGREMGAITAIGENVAYGQLSAKEVVNDWLTSPGHRRNIEGNFSLTGIGLSKDRKGMTYYTQIFTR